jgi:hypothetical protein
VRNLNHGILVSFFYQLLQVLIVNTWEEMRRGMLMIIRILVKMMVTMRTIRGRICGYSLVRDPRSEPCLVRLIRDHLYPTIRQFHFIFSLGDLARSVLHMTVIVSCVEVFYLVSVLVVFVKVVLIVGLLDNEGLAEGGTGEAQKDDQLKGGHLENLL